MKLLLVFLFSSSVYALPTYLNEKDEKIFCEKVKADPEVNLIYRAKDNLPDPQADRALWWTFKRKVSDKIPVAFGDRKKMKEGQSWRYIQTSDKERMMKCFHGPSYVYPVNPRNTIGTGHPLLSPDDPEKILELFKSVADQEKIKIEGVVYDVSKVLKNLEAYNNKKTDDLSHCQDELVGIASKKNPIKRPEFLKMFKDVICKNGTMPSVVKSDKWHKDFHKGIAPPFSKLLVALSNGDSSRVLPTMKERELQNWILDQKNRSVTIHEVFSKAYELNGGDVFKSLLTIENVLSEDFYNPRRQNLALSTRMSKIINHKGGNFDLYGAWYHLFGMLAYGFDSGSKFKANFIGKVETGTSLVYGTSNEKQENFMIQGGPIGADLRDQLKKIKTKEDFQEYCKGSSEVIKTSDYLNLLD